MGVGVVKGVKGEAGRSARGCSRCLARFGGL